MNWGWDGNYDNIFYKPTKDWSAGGYDFNLNHRLFVRVRCFRRVLKFVI